MVILGCPNPSNNDSTSNDSIPDDSISQNGINIYVCGRNDTKPCYWVNSRRVDLEHPSYPYGYITDIKAYNGKVYVSGYVLKDQKRQACYWIDNDFFLLYPHSGEQEESMTEKMIIIDNIFYIVGYYSQNGISYACYWKNGELVTLQNEKTNKSGGASIYVKNNNIYVGGAYLDDEKKYTPCYWLNGEMVTLQGYGYINFIDIQNDKLILAGFNHEYFKYGRRERGCRWENDDFTIYTDVDCQVKDIFVFNNKVYLTGCYFAYISSDKSMRKACYYIDTKKIEISVPFYEYSEANCIIQYEGEIYMAGETGINGEYPPQRRACYWIGNVFYTLPGGQDSYATNIFVNRS